MYMCHHGHSDKPLSEYHVTVTPSCLRTSSGLSPSQIRGFFKLVFKKKKKICFKNNTRGKRDFAPLCKVQNTLRLSVTRGDGLTMNGGGAISLKDFKRLVMENVGWKCCLCY